MAKFSGQKLCDIQCFNSNRGIRIKINFPDQTLNSVGKTHLIKVNLMFIYTAKKKLSTNCFISYYKTYFIEKVKSIFLR